MLCEKCGTPIPEEEKVCPACGAEAAQSPAPEAQVPVKKKGAGKKIIAAVVVIAVVLGGLGIAFLPKLTNFIKKNTMEPAEYYRYVEEKSIDAFAGAYETVYNENADELTATAVQMAMSAELSEKAQELLEQAAGADMSWLGDTELRLGTELGEELVKLDVSALIGEQQLSAQVVQDFRNMVYYYALPGLTDEKVKMSMSEADAVSFPGAYDMTLGKDVVDILARYLKAAASAVENVEMASETLKTEGFSVPCTVITSDIDANTVVNMAKKMVELAEGDEELKSLMKELYLSSGEPEEDFESGYTENVIGALKDAVASLNAEDMGELGIEYKVWVDDSGNIVGREVDADGMANVRLYYPEKGGKSALELSVSAQEASVGVSGSLDNGEGVYSVSYNGAKLLDITVEGCTLDSTEFSAEMKLSEEFGSMLSAFATDEASRALADYTFRYEFTKDDEKNEHVKLIVKEAEEELGSLSISASIVDSIEVFDIEGEEFVDGSDYEALEAFFAGIDAESLVQSLPESLVSLIEEAMTGGYEELPYDETSDLDWSVYYLVDFNYGCWIDELYFMFPDSFWAVADYDVAYEYYEPIIASQTTAFEEQVGADLWADYVITDQQALPDDTFSALADNMFATYGYTVSDAVAVSLDVTVTGQTGSLEFTDQGFVFAYIEDGWYPVSVETNDFLF